MKKNKPILDERILHSIEKINSNAFYILLTLLTISVLTKSLILDMPFKSYVFESAIGIISGIYVCIKNIISGNIFYTPSIKNELIISLVISIIMSTAITLKSYIKYGGIPIWFFASFVITFSFMFIITFTALYIYNRLTKINADKIFKKYNHD